MSRTRPPRPHEIAAAKTDPRLLAARQANPDDPDWRTNAACRDLNTDLFFPLPGESDVAALFACSRCPVQATCLAAALNAGDTDSISGGTTPTERRPMLYAWRDKPAPASVTRDCVVCKGPFAVSPPTSRQQFCSKACHNTHQAAQAAARPTKPPRPTRARGRRVGRVTTHCPYDHEYSEENTYWRPGRKGKPTPMCRKCKAATRDVAQGKPDPRKRPAA